MRVPSVGEVAWLLARAGVKAVAMQQRRSPGGKGWHVEIVVEPAPRTCMEVAALQAVLGSDVKREACNVNRARMVDGGKVPRYWQARDPQFGVRRRQTMRGLFREGDDDGEEMHVIGERSCALCRGHGRVCGVRCSWCGGSGLTCDGERG